MPGHNHVEIGINYCFMVIRSIVCTGHVLGEIRKVKLPVGEMGHTENRQGPFMPSEDLGEEEEAFREAA